jgi:hypothetical protein
VYVRKIIERALAHKASGFILAHNHPSGDPTPSSHDRELTQAVKAAAAAVGIRFLDHLIIGDTAPFSFKANDLIQKGVENLPPNGGLSTIMKRHLQILGEEALLARM